jgi:Family of unknown function (DUF5681)
MAETERNYEIGYGKPPIGRRFQKGRSGNPSGRRGPGAKKNLSALLIAALEEPVTLALGGKGRRITKREAIIAQLVDKSAAADLRATRMLIDMLKEVEEKAGAAAPEPEASFFTPADEEVIENLIARLRAMEKANIHHRDTENTESIRSSSRVERSDLDGIASSLGPSQ